MDARYLFKRHNTWWVKIAVPRTLRDKLGYDLRESLKTHDLSIAQEERWTVIDKFRNKISSSKSEVKKLTKHLGTQVVNYMPPSDTSDPQYYHKVVDCQYACPAHTNVPEYIRQIYQGNYTGENM